MLNALIIGTGAIAATHVASLKALSDRITIYAVADIIEEKAKQFAERNQIDVKIGNYQDLIQDESIDVVAVCTPPSTHCSIAVDCLNAGKHVLIEKPMAASVEECDIINAAAARNNRLVSVIAQSRFEDDVRKIRAVLQHELSGKLLYAEADSVWWRDNCYYSPDWRGVWEMEGGGCTLNHAVHHIDLLLWLAGEVSSVTAIMANQNHSNSEEEDISMALVRFKNGAVGRITASLIHHSQNQRMVFETEGDEVTMPYSLTCAKALGNGFPQEDTERKAALDECVDQVKALEFTGHTGQWANLIAAIQGTEELIMTGEDGRNAIELIIGIYQSASEGQEIVFPINSSSAFYTKKGVLDGTPRFNKKPTNLKPIEEGPMILANKDYKKEGNK